MTALNFENDRRKRMARDLNHDDLPPTGSWADRARYFDRGDRKKHAGYQQRSGASRPAKCVSQPSEYAQLLAYVEHASHNDFWRKSEVQRVEILKWISKLHFRCMQLGPSITADNQKLLQKAIDIIHRGRFTH